MKLPIITTLAIALSVLTATLVEAKVYKWQDADGVIHYASTPPKPDEKISGLKDDLRITDNRSAAHKNEQETQNNDEINKKNKEQKQNRNEKERKQNYCDGQRRNLTLLKRNLKVKWIENGKSTELNSEQRNEKLRALEDSISADCTYGKAGEEKLKHQQKNTDNDVRKKYD
jgi:hypothetical protein